MLSVAGLAFCLLSVFKMTDAICVTQGCSVYEGISVGGLSLYWFGAAAFGMLLVCAVARGGKYLAGVAALFLILDMGFMGIQILLWPCIQCLVVAAFFGAVMAVATVRSKKSWMRWILTAWFLLWCVNGVAAAKESIVPWAAYGTDAAPAHLFFSPTCPACREMIAGLLTKPDLQTQIALYPVAKNAEDTQRILILEQELAKGTPLKEALNQCEQAPLTEKAPVDMAYLDTLWKAFRNMSVLSRSGVTHIPFLTARSPFWSEASRTTPPQADCPMFSKDASGLCQDAPAGGSGLKELLNSK